MGPLSPQLRLATCPAPCLARGDTAAPAPHSSGVTHTLMRGWDQIWVTHNPNVSTHHPRPDSTDASPQPHTGAPSTQTGCPTGNPQPPSSHSSPITQHPNTGHPSPPGTGPHAWSPSLQVPPCPLSLQVPPCSPGSPGPPAPPRGDEQGQEERGLCRSNADTATTASQDRGPQNGHPGMAHAPPRASRYRRCNTGTPI